MFHFHDLRFRKDTIMRLYRLREKYLTSVAYFVPIPVDRKDEIMTSGLEPKNNSIELDRDYTATKEQALYLGVRHGKMAVVRVNPRFLSKRHLHKLAGTKRQYDSVIPGWALSIVSIMN